MASNQPDVFIDGEAGSTGVEVRKRLERLPEIVLRSLPEAQRKDPSARQDMIGACDLVVLCLPDDAAREAVAMAEALGDRAPKLLDASTAHRIDPVCKSDERPPLCIRCPLSRHIFLEPRELIRRRPVVASIGR